MKLPIYLDNQATTPVDPLVLEVMLPYFTEIYGNAASSSHPHGWKAREAVEVARRQVAQTAGAEPDEVIFTSGATEAINMVIKGIARNKPWPDIHVVTCSTEHSAVLDCCSFIERLGARITRLPVTNDGTLDLQELEAVIANGADLVTLMHGNNEIGTVHPIAEIGALCQDHNIPFHVDAAQTFGKLPIQLRNWNISYMSVSGHKHYAPKGIGCLLIKRQNPPLRLTALMHGGGHERGFRSGTLNVPGIVGFGKAAELCMQSMAAESMRTARLRDMLLELLQNGISDLIINGTLAKRLPGNLNVSIPGIEGQLLLPGLRDHICVSSGSACTSAHPKPSHVLAALGRSDQEAQASIRFGIGRFNCEEEIRYAASAIIDVVLELRKA